MVDELVQGGDDVVALTRSRSKATHLPEEVTIVEGDITEKETLREGIAGTDGVFHIAGWAYIGPGPRNVEMAERINVEGTRNVLELMAEFEIPKEVYTSTVGIHGLRGDRINESQTYDGPFPSVYLRTKWRAQYEVVNPMWLRGCRSSPSSQQLSSVQGTGWWARSGMFRDYLRGDLPIIPRGTKGPFDYVKDTARWHALVPKHGGPGEEYIIAGESYTFVEIFDLAEELTGIPAPRAVPPVVFRVLARVMRLIERFRLPPEAMQAERLHVLAKTDLVVDNSKAVRELGIDHRPIEEGLAEYLEWEMAQLDRPT